MNNGIVGIGIYYTIIIITVESHRVSPIVFGHPPVLNVVVPPQRVVSKNAVGQQVGEHAAGNASRPADTWNTSSRV